MLLASKGQQQLLLLHRVLLRQQDRALGSHTTTALFRRQLSSSSSSSMALLSTTTTTTTPEVMVHTLPKKNSYVNNHLHSLLVAGAMAVVAASTTSQTTQSEKKDNNTAPMSIHASKAQVDVLVQEMLHDPDINMPLVPDALEGRLYRSTIIMTLDAFYSFLRFLDGMPLLSHELKLTSRAGEKSSSTIAGKLDKELSKEKINEQVLEKVADRLLANPSINVAAIPDVMERQIYINCIKVVFRVLQRAMQATRITICGHDIQFTLKPSSLENSAMLVSASLGKMDSEKLKQLARQAGVDDTARHAGWWESMWLDVGLHAQMHASLYNLILGIVDDILANTTIYTFSDEIELDIVPMKPKVVVEMTETKEVIPKESISVFSFAAASFAAGVGVGVTLMAVLTIPR